MCIFVNKYVFLMVMVIGNVECNPVVTNLNKSVREFAAPEDVNVTSVRTLQKEEFQRYASSAPVNNPIRFKKISDNELSSSSSRALHHEHNGYGILDYDDNQQHGHGLDFHPHVSGHGVQGHHGLQGHHGDHGLHGHYGGYIDHGLLDHHHGVLHGHHETHVLHGDGYIHGHGYGHGYGHGHDKHLAHALVAKTILLPIAGFALLGAAAALVSNPVLLQLGVVSGRRKREASKAIDYDPDLFTRWLTTYPRQINMRTQTDSEKRTTQINGFKIFDPIDGFRKENLDDVPKDKRETLINKDDVLKRHRMSRLLNVNKRMLLRKPSANPVYVNQPDLPRTESDEDKHYIAVPLLSNS